jgi:hypothetical protein
LAIGTATWPTAEGRVTMEPHGILHLIVTIVSFLANRVW